MSSLNSASAEVTSHLKPTTQSRFFPAHLLSMAGGMLFLFVGALMSSRAFALDTVPRFYYFHDICDVSMDGAMDCSSPHFATAQEAWADVLLRTEHFNDYFQSRYGERPTTLSNFRQWTPANSTHPLVNGTQGTWVWTDVDCRFGSCNTTLADGYVLRSEECAFSPDHPYKLGITWVNDNPADVIAACYEQQPNTEPPLSCSSNGSDSGGGGIGVGKPIYPSTGAEVLTETDYQGPGGLQFIRTYRSDRRGWSNNLENKSSGISGASSPKEVLMAAQSNSASACIQGTGSTIATPYCYPTLPQGWNTSTGGNFFVLGRGNNKLLSFAGASTLSAPPNVNDRVTRLVDGSGNPAGWRVYNASNDATENYDANARLQSSTARNGQVTTYTYSDATTPSIIAPKPGLLIKVTDAFGRSLSFTYNSAGQIATMTDPANGVYTYAYDEPSSYVIPGSPLRGNLTSVTYPDNTKRIYWYNEQANTSNVNLPNALTGITDENGVRYATIRYDSSGKGISTELANGVNRYTIAYPSLYSKSSVTDPLGTTRTYNFQAVLDEVKFVGTDQPAGAGCAAASNAITYDANGNVASRKDFNGNLTVYTYDLTRNLEVKRVEASGAAQARTISTQWHPTYRLPTLVAEPKKLTTYNYDGSGNLLSRVEQATADANGSQGFGASPVGNPRVWSYSYNSAGQVLTAIPPGGGITRYDYDGQGNLITVTDALGHVTQLSNYDANGRVGHITDPNGLGTDLIYSPRGWLTFKNTGGESTSYQYDGVGQLTQVTLPDGSTLHYTYDDAHRLTDISDNAGNTIHYTLDAMGNRISEQVKDGSGNFTRQITRVYDALNRLQQITGGVQ